MPTFDEWAAQLQLKPKAIGRLQLYSTGLSLEQHALTGIDSIDLSVVSVSEKT